jgi:gliding motility-associated-like protein
MDSYHWQDSSTGQFFQVTAAGAYWVTVELDQCTNSDTILVTQHDCEALLIIPNCFTPNGDGVNETFKAVSQNLSSYQIYIFNRWGQLLFESSDPEIGWDGKVNGTNCPVGTYFFLIKYTTDCSYGLDREGVMKGSVTLLI